MGSQGIYLCITVTQWFTDETAVTVPPTRVLLLHVIGGGGQSAAVDQISAAKTEAE